MMNKFKLFITLIALIMGNYWTANAEGTVRLVTTTDFTGPGSISEAVAALAGDGSVTAAVDTIRFSSELKGDTIVFGSQIEINGKNVVIDGEDNHIVLSGNNAVRLFYVDNYNFFTISNLTLTAGYDNNSSLGGGAIFLGGGAAVTFNNVRFDSNSAVNEWFAVGGAISINGGVEHLVIDHCTFIGNTTQSTESFYAYGDQGGGAIFSISENNIEISNCLFENNSSNTNGGAIVARNVSITGCVFKNNSAASFGGAFSPVSQYGDGTFTVKLLGNTFIGNHTQGLTDDYGGGGYNGGVFGTIDTNGNVVLAGNVFQDNYSGTSSTHNEFYRSDAAVTISSGGYNVFKGAAVPGTAANTWTNSANDLADEEDIVDGDGRISNTSPAFGVIPENAELIAGLAFPATDIFGNVHVAETLYNAGADQGGGEVVLADITAEQGQGLYNGEEKDFGISLVDAEPSPSLSAAFNVPVGLAFTAASATLKGDTIFTLSGISVEDNTRLLLTVNFVPKAELEYTDTLVVSAEGAYDFVLPLRGTGISWTVDPVAPKDFGRLAVGETSEPKSVTITGTSASGAFSYSLKGGTANATVFPIAEAEGYTAAGGGQLDIRFVPEIAGKVYADTLVIVSAGSDRSYEIALSGTALPVAVVSDLSFGEVVISSAGTITLPVTIGPGYGVAITSIAIPDGTDFSVVPASNWLEDEGGDLLVTFTPSAVGVRTATLTLDGSGSQSSGDVGFPYTVELTGTGLAQPVITSVPDSLEFDEVEIGNSATGTLTVTQSNPFAPLAESSFSLAGGEESVYGFSFAEDVVTVTFTPLAAVEYNDTLIINAAYADEVRIPLVGTGILGTGLSVPQESEIYLSVKEGAIVVHNAPVNSRIVLYSLQGVATLAQTVTSNEEILKTSGFARGVYILAVRNDKGEILKKLKVKN